MKPLKSAWIVRWEGTGPDVPTGLVAVLNYRRSSKHVASIVEQLYLVKTATDEEKAFYAHSNSNNPYPAKIDGWQTISCGHNPFLVAQLVRNLRKENDRFVWDDPFTPEQRAAAQKFIDQNRRAAKAE